MMVSKDLPDYKGNRNYLKTANRILRYSEKELKSAKKNKDEMKAMQASEKGYLALLKAIDALFVKKGVKEDKLPKGEIGRLHYLRKYTDRDFRTKYNAVRHSLHIVAFHEGVINFDQIFEQFEDLKEIFKRI